MEKNKVRKLTRDNIKEIHRDIEILRHKILMLEEELNYGELYHETYEEYVEAKQDFEF